MICKEEEDEEFFFVSFLLHGDCMRFFVKNIELFLLQKCLRRWERKRKK